MKVKALSAENGTNRFTVEAEWPELAADYDDILNSYSQVKITGFRPGKVPREVLENRFEKEILEDFSRRAAERLGREALREAGAEPLGGLEVSDMDCGKGKPLVFTASYRPMPEFKLPNLKSLMRDGKGIDLRDLISKRLLEQIKFDLPEELILAELKREEGSQSSDDSTRQAAADRLRLMLILKKIAKEEGINVTEEDVEQRIQDKATEFGENPDKLRKEFKRDGGWHRLKDMLLAEETLTYIVELNQA